MISFDIQTGVSVAVGFIAIIGGLVALFKWAHKMANKIDKGQRDVQTQITTSNGKTLAALMEDMAKNIRAELDIVRDQTIANKEKTELLFKRFDEHMTWGSHHRHDKEN